ncbi:MAG: cadherin domain-containing protein, partial [Nitrospira sp.]|nr:cadherin domain-containing protein [Nitrospira sp.]
LATLSYQGNLNYSGADLLTVTSTDSNAVVDTDTVAITVTSVNDAPNIVNATVSLNENRPNGTAVYNVNDSFTGTDLDRDGTAITYSITGGNGLGGFAINPATGQISVNNSAVLDYETTPSFTLTVQASDGTLTGTATITINLTDVVEGLPPVQPPQPFPPVPPSLVPQPPSPPPDPGSGPGPGPGPNPSGLPSAGGVLSLPFVLPPPDRAWIPGGDRGDVAGGTGPRVGTSSLMPTKSVEGAVKHPPLNIVPEGQTVSSGASLSLAGISVTDEDGDLATVQLMVTNGTLTVTLAGEAAIAKGANGASTMTLSGTEDEINATLATLTYRSASNYSGTDTLVLLSTDVKGSMDSTTVNITVSAASGGATSHDSLAAQLNRLADELERKMQEREEQAHLIGRIAAFSGVALSAGFVTWLLRGGSLLASFLVSLPAWRHFDPLPVLGLGRRRRKERDQEMREDHEQENREFQGLDRILKSRTQMTKQQDANRGRHPEA